MRTLRTFTKEDRKVYTAELADRIRKEYAAEIRSDCTVYECILQGTKFRCFYTDDELRAICRYAFELAEKLKEKVNAGMTAETLEEETKKISGRETVEPDTEQLGVLARMPALMDRPMWDMYFAVAKTARVGGAFLAIASGPMFQSAIYSGFDVMRRYAHEEPPCMDDPEIYVPYFIARAAMKMHSEEIQDKKPEMYAETPA